MDFNKTLSTLTFAGLAGLLVFNWRGVNELIKTLGGAANNYVGTVRGDRPGLVG
jgi:hypothetical protein